MNKQLLSQLVLIFIITQTLGLYAGSHLMQEGVKATIVNEDPESVDNSIGLLAWILISTGALLLILRFAPEWLMYIFLKAIESLAIWASALIVLFPVDISVELALGLATLLVALRILLKKNILLRNVSSIIATAGAGALIGASLGVVPLLVFLVLLAAYDFIAVFKTKHMVTLAKGITGKNLSFTFALPTKEHQFELGTGDLVVPLAFAVSVLGATRHATPYPFNFVPVAAILAASLAGLLITLNEASKRKGVPLPALPLQSALMAVVFIATKIIGY